MPYINGAITHVPKPPPAGSFKRAKDAFTNSAGFKRNARKAGKAYGNATSKPQFRAKAGSKGKVKSGKFGQASSQQKFARHDQLMQSASAGASGVAIGGTLGSLTFAGTGGPQKKIERNKREIGRNKREIKSFEKKFVPRAKLITDLGTKGERIRNKVEGGHHPGKVGAAATGATFAGVTGLGLLVRSENKKTLKSQNKTLTTQRAQLSGLRKSAVSAFGISHA